MHDQISPFERERFEYHYQYIIIMIFKAMFVSCGFVSLYHITTQLRYVFRGSKYRGSAIIVSSWFIWLLLALQVKAGKVHSWVKLRPTKITHFTVTAIL